jgi:hypothetical protein
MSTESQSNGQVTADRGIQSENAARSRQGVTIACSGEHEADRVGAIDAAFDYRGDVTLRLTDGSELVGYVANRDADRGELTIFPTAGGRQTLAYERVAAVDFSGRDPAAGHTWEAWLKRYVEKKAAGESASLESEHQG